MIKQFKINLLKIFVFGLQAATRIHKVGVSSNHKLVCYGELVPLFCTHRPSHGENKFGLKSFYSYRVFKNLTQYLCGFFIYIREKNAIIELIISVKS